MAAKKPTNRKRGHRQGIDPESGLGKKLAKRTEENLRPSAKVFRDRFIAEYLIDHNAAQAYVRAGGEATGRAIYNIAYELTHEPYVAKKIQEAIDAAEEKTLINRQRIIAGLVREANYNGLSASHGARVSAYSKLANILGMDVKRVEANVGMKAGVLIVPATEDITTWEERSRAAQLALKEAVRS